MSRAKEQRSSRVEGLELEERRWQEPADRPRAGESHEHAGAERQGIAQDHPDHVGAGRAERHADAELVGPARHHVGEQSAESNGGEEERDDAERAGHETQQPLGPKRAVDERVLRVELGHRDGRIDRGHRLPNRLSQPGGVHRGADGEVDRPARRVRLIDRRDVAA